MSMALCDDYAMIFTFVVYQCISIMFCHIPMVHGRHFPWRRYDGVPPILKRPAGWGPYSVADGLPSIAEVNCYINYGQARYP